MMAEMENVDSASDLVKLKEQFELRKQAAIAEVEFFDYFIQFNH